MSASAEPIRPHFCPCCREYGWEIRSPPLRGADQLMEHDIIANMKLLRPFATENSWSASRICSIKKRVDIWILLLGGEVYGNNGKNVFLLASIILIGATLYLLVWGLWPLLPPSLSQDQRGSLLHFVTYSQYSSVVLQKLRTGLKMGTGVQRLRRV